MAESPLSAHNTLHAWLANSGDAGRLAALVAASQGRAIDGMAMDRLPARAISACLQAESPRFEALRPSVRLAALVCGLGQKWGIAVTPEERQALDAIPFQVRVAGDELVIEIPLLGERRPGYGQQAMFHQWVAGIQASAIAIDCGKLEHVNSVFIAWLLQMVQSAKPVPVRVRSAKSQVAIQLRQLRLDHLVVIE